MATSLVWTPYCGAAPAPAEALARWNGDPVLLTVGVLTGYVLVRAYGRDPGFRPRLAACAALALFVSFVSPLCALSSALFSARVAHHVLLMAIAAPLFVWSLPRRVLAGRSWLIAATALQALVLWAWHAPGLYAAALSNDAVYWLMQASLGAAACAFWMSVRSTSSVAGAAALLATMVQMGLLGALLTFSNAALYAPHIASAALWGLTPLADQQLGGLIMWAPAAAFYLGAALLLIHRAVGPEPRPV
jgi:putative membrane protein